MDISQLNDIHAKQVDNFIETLEHLRDREKEVIALIAQLKQLKNETEVKLVKITTDSLEAERLKKESELDREQAGRDRLQGEAFKHTRSELMVYVRDEEKKVKQEWSLVDSQRKDLDERQKENSRKEKYLAVDEDRILKIRAQVDKMIHANNLDSIIKVPAMAGT